MYDKSPAEIIDHVQVATGYFRMMLAAPAIAAAAQPGHFVHIMTRPGSLYDPLLRRAFSIMQAEEGNIEILYRVEGKGTLLMSQWQRGYNVDLLGPLGSPFALEAPYAVLVGGGVGIPPMVMMASRRAPDNTNRDRGSPRSTIALIGVRSSNELICIEDFARYQVPVAVATDDGSVGHHGFVTELLKQHLEQAAQEAVLPTVFACGPLPMLRAVASLCTRYNAPCQVSLEENMPCGVGVCNGCVVPVQGSGDDYSRYRRICVEGPVLWAHEVDWSHYSAACLSTPD